MTGPAQGRAAEAVRDQPSGRMRSPATIREGIPTTMRLGAARSGHEAELAPGAGASASIGARRYGPGAADQRSADGALGLDAATENGRRLNGNNMTLSHAQRCCAKTMNPLIRLRSALS